MLETSGATTVCWRTGLGYVWFLRESSLIDLCDFVHILRLVPGRRWSCRDVATSRLLATHRPTCHLRTLPFFIREPFTSNVKPLRFSHELTIMHTTVLEAFSTSRDEKIQHVWLRALCEAWTHKTSKCAICASDDSRSD